MQEAASGDPWQGNRADVDLETLIVATGKSVFHPLQVQTSGTPTDFLGWGTYKGKGSSALSGGECVDHYSAGWKLYFDGTKFGTYFCHSDYGSVSETAANQLFTLKSGTCDGITKWRALLNGVVQACNRASGYKSFATADGLEVLSSTTLRGDVRYHNAELYDDVSNAWISWSNNPAVAELCETPGYEVIIVPPDDITIEMS